nr:GntR family transcriptional regulator [Marinicella sp. W31]MDC2879197.1 GntR family transcriptional regulator [Marinicella sp. W31]
MATQTAARNGTLVYKVSEALRKSILDGAYLPGEKLPSEAQLTQEHGVSRTVVREAVAALRSDGLVEPRQGAGVFVLDPISFAFKRTNPMVDQDRIYTSLEILEARTPLEIEAAGLAALRRSPRRKKRFSKNMQPVLPAAMTVKPGAMPISGFISPSPRPPTTRFSQHFSSCRAKRSSPDRPSRRHRWRRRSRLSQPADQRARAHHLRHFQW